MVSQRAAKVLILIAGMLAIAQAIVNFARFDSITNDDNREASGHRLNEYIDDNSTYCGFMSISNAPVNVGEKDAECIGDSFEMDRGWFVSTKEHCKDDCKYRELLICSLKGWDGIMIFNIYTGIFWIAVGVTFIIVVLKEKKRIARLAL